MFRKRIIALSFVFVICFSCIAPFAHADDYQSSIVGLWDSFFAYGSKVSEDVPVLGDIMQGITSLFVGAICPTSDDRYHHTNSIVGCETGKDNHGYYAVATCSYCGQHFKCYSSDLSAAYDNCVDSIQTDFNTTICSANGLCYPLRLSSLIL